MCRSRPAVSNMVIYRADVGKGGRGGSGETNEGMLRSVQLLCVITLG